MTNEALTRLLVIAVIVVLVAVWLIPSLARGQGIRGIRRAGEYQRSLVVRGLKRTFLVHVPQTPRAGGQREKGLPGSGIPTGGAARPLVIVLHGGGGAGNRIARLTGFSRLADREGFIVVYPDAINNHWNDGRNVANFRSQRENIDDVGFISDLIDRLDRQLGIDPDRIYATGISNGAMMCHRVACELSGRIAAIAPVCGALPEDLANSCRPSRPVSVLMVNGTEDPFVPWAGGGVGLLNKRGTVQSVPQTVEAWVGYDQCSPTPVVTELPDRDPNDGTTVSRATYSGGAGGTEVVLYTVHGGGHTWPGGAERPERFGRQSNDLNATEAIWEFFARHARASANLKQQSPRKESPE